MEFGFYDTHMDTLIKLTELVKKHGMKIRIGHQNNFTVERDLTILDTHAATEILEKLNDKYSDIIEDKIIRTNDTLWFELYEPLIDNKSKYHVMSFITTNIDFKLKSEWENELNKINDEYKEDSGNDQEIDTNVIENINQLSKFINENKKESYYVSFKENSTIIRGFGNKELIIDHRVYRSGMALHFFTELVCKYLNEPVIINTY